VAERSEILQALVDEDDLDRLLTLVSLADLAAAWCRYASRPHSPDETDGPDWWAVDLFYNDEIYRRPELYRALVLTMVDQASEAVLGAIGAGPLENFVSNDEDDLLWLERECSTNPKLRIALSGVWFPAFMSEEAVRRLEVAAGVHPPRQRE
jgi:hypothetical protein